MLWKAQYQGMVVCRISKTAQSSIVWNTGIWNQNQHGIRHGVNGIRIYGNGDTTISGTLNSQRLYITNSAARPIDIKNAMHNGPYLAAKSQNHSNNGLLFALRCLPLNQLWCFGVSTSNQYIISHENSTKLSIQSNGNTTINGNLNVGPAQAVTSITAYVNHAGHQGNVETEAMWNTQG